MKRANAIIIPAAILLAALFSAHPTLFEWSRARIASGEYWRLLTGHFVHFKPQHFCANIAAMVLLIYLMPPVSLRKAMWLGVWTPILLGILLLFGRPDLAIYGGLSGWLAAIFISVAAEYARRPGWVGQIFRLSIMVFLLKVIFEFGAGKSLFAELGQGIVVEPAAHALGAAIAVMGNIFDPNRLEQTFRKKPQSPFGARKKAVPEGTA
ncbi:MAG: rhombosortase [Limisphaerales bacterium]